MLQLALSAQPMEKEPGIFIPGQNVAGESTLFSLPAADKSAVPEKDQGDVEKWKAKAGPNPPSHFPTSQL